MRYVRLAVPLVATALAGGCLDSPGDDGADGPGDSRQLLANPDFEDDVEGWNFMGSVEIATDEELGFPPSEAGALVALLGRDHDQMDVMWQELEVPDWATQLELSGHRCFATNEGFDQEYDHLTISIQPVEGGAIEELIRDSNLDSTVDVCDWTPFRVLTEPHAGERIRLTIFGETDSAGPTSFALDGLALIANP